MANNPIINHVLLPNNTTYDVQDDYAIESITRSGNTFTATRRNGTTFTFDQKDDNTTYTLTQSQSDAHSIIFTDSAGNSATITIPDANTTYTIEADTTNNQIKLVPSSGSAVPITVPFATNATNAVNATKATQDESGNNIKGSYAASMSVDTTTNKIQLKNKNGIVLSEIDAPSSGNNYTFAEGGTNGAFEVTPDGENTQVVTIHGLGTAAFANIVSTYSATGTAPVNGTAVAAALATLPTPMTFQGTLGENGTITALPTASASTVGYTYRVIKDGTYAGQAAKDGDEFIGAEIPKNSGTYVWVYIPSGDEPSGTVTNIATGTGLTGGPISTSGTISHADTSSQASVSNSGRTYIQSITLDGMGHVTGLSSATETVTNTDRYVNSAAFADDTTANANSPVKMTLTRAGSDSATVIANIPKVSSSSAGVAPKGAAVSSQSQSTKFLREDGSWAAPSYTTNTDTKATQTASSDDANYEVLFSGTADNTTRTEGTRKSNGLIFNPSTGELIVRNDSSPGTSRVSTYGVYVKDCQATPTQTNQFGYYQWGDQVQFTYRNASNAYLGRAFCIYVTDGHSEWNKTAIYKASMYPNETDTYYSGDANRKWKGVYATTFYGDLSGTASKLGTNAGSATNPVYFSGGVPVACTYTLEKSVPSNAVFTDTNNAVTQTASTGSANYEVLFSGTADNTTRTEGARKNSNLLFNPSTGNLQATQLNGVTIGDSPKFTDTNTWRGIQDNLTSSTNTTESLSAKQGYLLATGSARDSTKMPLSGGTLTGELINQQGGIWVQGGSAAGGNVDRMTLTAGMPTELKYNSGKRGLRLYSNAVAIADPYNGNSNNDAGWIRHIEETSNSTIFEIATGDNGNESIVMRQYNTSSAVAREAKILGADGATSFPVSVTAPKFIGNLQGIADNADKVDGYHMFFERYTNAYAFTQPTADTEWIIKVVTGDWNRNAEIIQISSTGDNRTQNTILHTGARQSYWWGYVTTYNANTLIGVKKEVASGDIIYLRFSAGCTSATVYTTFTATTAAVDSLSGDTTVPSTGGFFANTITTDVIGNATSATKANLTTTQYGIAFYSTTDGTFGNNPCLITTSTGGLEVKGTIAGDTGATGHGLYGGGGYHNAYNNIILHGDASTGSSGIAFVSDKINASTGAVTNVNQPSDRAFIQYHACGITTATTEGTNPTLATSGESGKFVIGIGNDADDQIWLQTPSRVGLIHQVATGSYVIPDTGNTSGNVGSGTQPVYVSGGVITATTYSLGKSVPSDAVFTDTNYYHTTGSWSGLTYTATANGGAGALAFTIPTGTSATTVAVGNHNHNGTYVKVAGDSMTGTLCMNSATGNYGEGIRINAGNGGYSSFTLGTEANSTRGISDCGFWIGTNRTNATYQRKLFIAHNASTASETYFYASSATDHSPSLQVGGIIAGKGVVAANTTCSSTVGGLALYGTSPTDYGIAFRGTGNGGKHGYVQGDWAQYHYMAGADTRGWVFNAGASTGVASISRAGHMVLNGSLTVGGNAANTNGCRMIYNSSLNCLDFQFAS